MIALDAMGGDYAPTVAVRGAYAAAQKGVAVALFGDQSQIEAILADLSSEWRSLPITIEDCSQVITMAEEPSFAVVRKKDASLVRAVQAVAQGRASAVVSAGNSGAMLAAGTLLVGRLPGILRPALGAFLPTKKGSAFCLDLGANTDCKPEYLEQFAHMGCAYVNLLKDIKQPRVGLLSNGVEPYKGSLSVKAAYELLEKSNLNFIGNIESRDIFDDTIDVLVCDGFAGNVLLKGVQGAAGLLMHWLRQEAHATWLSKFYFWIGARFFKTIREKSDYYKKGGALLLGVKKPVVVAHGSSNEVAIEHALIFAHELVQKKVVERCNERIEQGMNIFVRKDRVGQELQ